MTNKAYITAGISAGIKAYTQGNLVNPAFIAYRNTILADGGEIDSYNDLNSYIRFAKANGIYDSIKFGMLGAYKLRTSGNTNYITIAYSLDSVPNNATQTTESLQPFQTGFIAPNEKWGAKNPSGGSRLFNIPSLTITGTITTVEFADNTCKFIVTHTDVTAQTITQLIPKISTRAYIVRDGYLSAQQKIAEANWFKSHNYLGYEGTGIDGVKIGDQVCSTSNFDAAASTNGTVISNVTDNTAWATGAAAWAYQNNDPALGAIYNKLYNKAARDIIIANPPAGWHVATEAELTTLSANGGNALKHVGNDYWNTTGGTNTTGFTAIGSGSRNADGTFSTVKSYAGIWCADSDKVMKIYHDNNTAEVVSVASVNEGYSIRLVKD